MRAALTFNRGQPRTGLIHPVEAVKWGFLHVLQDHIGDWGKGKALFSWDLSPAFASSTKLVF